MRPPDPGHRRGVTVIASSGGLLVAAVVIMVIVGLAVGIFCSRQLHECESVRAPSALIVFGRER